MALEKLDLTEQATTTLPIFSQTVDVALILDGQVFDNIGLRADAERSDEALDADRLLQLYQSRGPAMVEALNGEFSLILYDASKNTLLVARDRIGITSVF
ncbi:hypothetical protein B0A48_13156 [Cryoendolithus antarcticus]|uniref:Glutamine amidotransferase type-2 domain-containing protein n=1 Tax=Cryoendolithus antarcticus TaxID=1507870 RepID=A0A1V8SNC2_9PEZI|nr:hypothetical protein B0A48_13156 [Cryoendolithus antarcticus]